MPTVIVEGGYKENEWVCFRVTNLQPYSVCVNPQNMLI